MNLFVRKMVAVSLLGVLAGYSSLSIGHARWALDGIVKPRTDDDGLKEPRPCGGAQRTNTPTVLKSGDTIVVEFEETINHIGYFRIAFSAANDQGFDDNVLVERIPEVRETRFYQQAITLPNIECESCTLQLIQVMEDRTPATNYYSCADIQLTATGTIEPPVEDSTPPDNVNGVVAEAGDAQIDLRWRNPGNDFFETLMLQSETPITLKPFDTIQYQVNDRIGDATVVFRGNGTRYLAGNLTNGKTYYFGLYAYDAAKNYAGGVTVLKSLRAEPANLPPSVSLLAEQRTQVTQTITTTGGEVVIQAAVDDPNPADRHTYSWSGTDSALVDLDFAANNFTFDPSGVVPGVYTVRVDVRDNGTPVQRATAELELTVIEEAPNEPEDAGDISEDSGDIAEDDSTVDEISEERDSESGSGSVSAFFLFMLFGLGLFSRRSTRR